MKFVRFEYEGSNAFGTLDDGVVHVLQGDMYGVAHPTGLMLSASTVKYLPPAQNGTMFALWNNSRPQIAKLQRTTPQEALWFIKPVSSFATHGDPILYPEGETEKVVLEGELGIVIGRFCRSVRPEDAAACIFGYTLINDVTAQDLVGRDSSFPQYTRAKGFDSFGLHGPAVETEIDPMTLRIQSFVNGRECQNYPVTDLVFDPYRIVAEISRNVTLRPGDVIACGTSLGVTPILPGDEVEVRIEGIGRMINWVRER